MADNYLERKFEEYNSGGRCVTRRRGASGKSLDSLLLRNRSYRGYDREHKVQLSELREIVAVNTKIPSARNQQVLRFKLVTSESGAERLLPLTRWAGALPQLHLPFPGTEPEAFIVVCSTVQPSRWVYTDLGISAQSMLLKATEMGLGGICIGSFDSEAVKREFGLDLEPLLVIAIGKPAEKIQLKTISSGENHDYYRKDGIHYVPKVTLSDLVVADNCEAVLQEPVHL